MKRVQNLHFSVKIDASREKVWNTMLNDETYRQWTSEFTQGSYFEGSWEEGEKITFLDPAGNGMLAQVVKNQPYQYLSIKHIGELNKGVEDTTSEEVRAWAPAYESYTFEEEDGKTQLLVEAETAEAYLSMMKRMWPKALQKLKEISERDK